MNVSRNRKNRKRSRYGWGNRMALIGITMVVLSLAVVVNIGASSLREKDLEYQAKEMNLEKMLAQEKARAAQLEEERILVQTKQNVAKIAREKLGLVDPNEIVIKPRNAE